MTRNGILQSDEIQVQFRLFVQILLSFGQIWQMLFLIFSSAADGL